MLAFSAVILIKDDKSFAGIQESRLVWKHFGTNIFSKILIKAQTRLGLIEGGIHAFLLTLKSVRTSGKEMLYH